MSKRSSRTKRREKQKEKAVSAGEGSNWLSPRECAEDFGVTPEAILKWIGEHKIAAKRVSQKCIRVARTEWERFKREIPDAAPKPAPAA